MRQLAIDGTVAVPRFAVFRDHCFSTWKEWNGGEAPTWDPKEFRCLKRILELTGADAFEIWDWFLADDDPKRASYIGARRPSICLRERDYYRTQIRADRSRRPVEGPADPEFTRKVAAAQERRRRKEEEAEARQREAQERRKLLLAQERPTITKAMVGDLRAILGPGTPGTKEARRR